MEYLNVYDDNLSLLNKKVKRGEQLPPNEHILITIIYIENNNHEFLIQKNKGINTSIINKNYEN